MSSSLRKIVSQRMAVKKADRPKSSASRRPGKKETGSGMNAYNLLARLKQAREAGVTELLDPGSGGVVRITKDLGILIFESTGTRTLQAAADVAPGTKVFVVTTSGCTINSTVIAAGGFAEFVVTLSSGDAHQWSVSIPSVHTHDAADIITGTMATARLGSGVADATKFLRGDQTWQPAGGAADGFTTIISSADEDKTNLNVAQDHSEFQFSVTAGKRYMVDMLIWVSANEAAADYGSRFAVAAGTMKGHGTLQHRNTADTQENILITVSGAAFTNSLSSGTNTDLEFGGANRYSFVFVPDTTTTFKFQFGNVGVAAGRTSRTGKGSIMRWKQMN